MTTLLADDPSWFKDAIIYELHVRAFYDSNGDGIGDFSGLIDKLDYLQDLGVTALWILPFYPSPLRDDGYDIADYGAVNPSYGSLRDFRRFLGESHKRGLRVITELVVNHTSTEHPWFQRARRSPPGSKYRDFYVWSDSPERYPGTRIIFQDFETSNWAWDPVAKQYYWHRFYSHQPDLNFDNPHVQKALFKVLDFWMDMGVDGMRLDAVPYLYEREGTNNENLPETHEFLKKLRTHIDQNYKNRMLLAEANQWPEDAAAYFGDGDECHMNFHFPLMPRMFMALQQENNFPILDILDQTPQIPENCQWAVFLRNHDELTLEMVTDADRDYMYRMYAEDPQARINVGIRRRLGPLLKVRRKIELMNGLLLSLPGTPVLYYGDEIGMGDNIYLGDRNGVRTPMQWSGDRNAGFSRANPQKLYLPTIIDPEYHYEAVNVEAHQNNPSSLLWWMKRILALRKHYKVFGRGTVEFLRPENPKVLAFIREHGNERVMVVANLSRFAQYVELDLRRFQGVEPVELFGHTQFPRIGELPYLLTLGPHAFYWFSIEDPAKRPHEATTAVPALETRASWEKLFSARSGAAVEKVLPRFIKSRRWFRSKARDIRGATILDAIPLPTKAGVVQVVLFEVSYVQDADETYVLPLAYSAEELPEDREHLGVGRLGNGVVYEATTDPSFTEALLKLLSRRRGLQGRRGELTSNPMRQFRELRGPRDADVTPRVMGAEQSNTSVLFGDRFIFKMFRRLDDGLNPDVEIGQFLTDKRQFSHSPPVAATLDYHSEGLTSSLGILQGFVPNQGDAWGVTLDFVDRAYERALSWPEHSPTREEIGGDVHLLDRAQQDLPERVAELIGGYRHLVHLLGERTAELHLALDGEHDDPDFRPEELTTLYQRSLYQAARTNLVQSFDLLKKQLHVVPEGSRGLARTILGKRRELDNRLRGILSGKIHATRLRVHGDYHLGQVLYTGNDFVIIDFEGEPARSIGERRLKASPLRDVAGMVRSFHYASKFSLRMGHIRDEDISVIEPWTMIWYEYVAAHFLRAYLDRASGASFIPSDPAHLRALLDFYLLDKSNYELGYELNNRPDWVEIPLFGLSELL